MSFGIRGEDQKVGCTGTPTNLLLVCVWEREGLQSETDSLCRSLHVCVRLPNLAHSSLDDSVKASLRGISVPGHHLLLHLLGEAAHLLRQSQNVFVAKLGQAGHVNAVSEVEKNNFLNTIPILDLRTFPKQP